ncbi:GT-D fold domain-containing protein [Siccirubricoccus phaeus]|uniref:GT-D fold domain-containing protein n=1 Tax=Siccirubricoccus phaeus TaxID=2595053 RepID=UPI0011F34B00|nr:hypothetical protein [Siccirubricoccus phaeus]
MDFKQPTITVFGSCRVHTPCSILHQRKAAEMHQGNIFGFAHYTSEIFQQFELITGSRPVPSRLRPFLNIPDNWRVPEHNDIADFHDQFATTDLFVVEVSSIRKLLFKSVYLQINRTRELLVSDDKTQKNWWLPLVRHGRNIMSQYNFESANDVQREVVNNLKVEDQSFEEILSDIKRIRRFLRKPVLFVSHFNTDYQGKSVPQRRLIIEAMEAAAVEAGCNAFDPTPYVLNAGLENSIQDLGHYKPAFEICIAERLQEAMRATLAPASSVRARARSKSTGRVASQPLSLRSMIRDNEADVGVTDRTRVRHFVAPFQKKLSVKPNSHAADMIRLLARGQAASCIEVGWGLGLWAARATPHPLLEGLDFTTVDYPYFLPTLQRLAPDQAFRPLSQNWQLVLPDGNSQRRILHLSGILERVPDPLGVLKAAAELTEPSSAIVVSMRPLTAASRNLPEDCYQQWTEEEFKRLAAAAGFRVLAQASNSDWWCYLLASPEATLAQLTGVEGTVMSGMTLRVGGYEYRFEIGVDGVPRLTSAPSDALPKLEAFEIDDLENLDHLKAYVSTAVQAHPREMRMPTNDSILRRIEESVLTRKPLSVVRVSHAEIRALAYPNFYPPVWLNRSLKVCFGAEIEVGDYGAFLSDLEAAIRSCDIVGVPDPQSRDLQHATNSILLDKEGITTGKDKFIGDLHFRLLNDGVLDRLIAKCASVSLITSRNILHGFRHKYSRPDARLIQIPGEARWMGDSVRRHVPDVYNEIVRDLKVREPGELFLVGAGLAAKRYCQLVRDQGGIAVDIGSVFDLWAGVATRSGFETRTELSLV